MLQGLFITTAVGAALGAAATAEYGYLFSKYLDRCRLPEYIQAIVNENRALKRQLRARRLQSEALRLWRKKAINARVLASKQKE